MPHVGIFTTEVNMVVSDSEEVIEGVKIYYSVRFFAGEKFFPN